MRCAFDHPPINPDTDGGTTDFIRAAHLPAERSLSSSKTPSHPTANALEDGDGPRDWAVQGGEDKARDKVPVRRLAGRSTEAVREQVAPEL